MESQRPQRESEPLSSGSPIVAAAILLAIYVAMYLTVGGLVHLLGAPADARIATAWPELTPATSPQAADPDGASSPREDRDAHTD